MLTIGKVAAIADVSTDALRHYEREGLLAPDSKTDAGYRLYGEDTLRRIRFIKHAQRVGFALSEIRDLLTLRGQTSACCADVRTRAIEKKLHLAAKIKTLQAMSSALDELVSTCRDDAMPLENCPILAALERSVESSS